MAVVTRDPSLKRPAGRGDAVPPLVARAAVEHAALVLRADYRPPLGWEALLRFLSARCTAGVEQVDGECYRRTVRAGARTGWVSLTRDASRPSIWIEVSSSLAGALTTVVAGLRALLDLDARPDEVHAALRRDPLLRASLRRSPGLRVPGAFDGFEAAARVVVGQQVSVAAATTISGRLAAAFGEPVETPFAGLDRVSASAEAIARAGEDRVARIGMPGARARTLIAVARAACDGLELRRGANADAVRAKLLELPGVGPWTSEVIAMRALGSPDAFPASDLGVLRAMGVASARAAEERAEAWRPWRSYAVMHLWDSAVKAGGA